MVTLIALNREQTTALLELLEFADTGMNDSDDDCLVDLFVSLLALKQVGITPEYIDFVNVSGFDVNVGMAKNG